MWFSAYYHNVFLVYHLYTIHMLYMYNSVETSDTIYQINSFIVIFYYFFNLDVFIVKYIIVIYIIFLKLLYTVEY